MNDSQLIAKLRELDKRWRAILLVSGVAKTGLYFLIAVLVFCVTDWLLQLPYFLRAPLAIVLYLGVAVHAWRSWLKTWLEPFSAEDAAWRVEDQRPDLREELISAVDFSQNPESNGSKALVQKVLEHTKLDMQKLGAKTTFPINWKQLRWPIALTAIMLVALAIPSLNFRQSLSRALMPGAGDASVGAILIDVVAPGDTQAVENSEITFTATRSGGELDDLELVLQGQSTRFLPLTYDFNTEQYATTVDGLHESVTYWVRSGRMRSKSHHLRIVELPRIEEFEIKYAYPAYTGQPPRNETSTSADLKALEGTQATLIATTNKPIKSATILFDKTDDASISSLEMEKQSTSKQARFLIPISTSTTFKLDLKDADGLSPELSPTYHVVALPDHPPTIELLLPAEDLAAKANESISLEWIAEDDFGIAAQQLLIRINQDDLPPQSLDPRADRTELNLKNLPLVPGDIAEISIHGRDHATKTTISNVRRITILNRTDTDNRPMRFFAAAEKLSDTLATLQKSQTQLANMASKLTSITNLESMDRRHYQTRFAEQTENVNDLLTVAKEQLTELQKNGFSPRSSGYAGLMKKFVQQEQFDSISTLRTHPSSEASEALSFVAPLSITLLDAIVVKGRQAAALRVTATSELDAKALASQLPSSAPRLQNVTTRISDATKHLDPTVQEQLPELQVDKTVVRSIKRMNKKLMEIARDYSKPHAAAQAILARLHPSSETLAKTAEKAAVHEDEQATATLEKMAEALKEEAQNASTPQERIDAAIQAAAIEQKLADKQPEDLLETAEAIAKLEDANAVEQAKADLQEQLKDTADAVAAVQEAFEKSPSNKEKLQATADIAEALAEHLEETAKLADTDELKQMENRAAYVKKHLEKAVEAAQKGDTNTAKKEIEMAVADVKNAARDLARAEKATEDDARQARQELESDTPSKADQIRDAAENLASAEKAQDNASAKEAADAQLAAVQQRLEDEAAVAKGPADALGGATEKDALAAALEQTREQAQSAPPQETADNLEALANLVEKHENLEDRTASLEQAKQDHQQILADTKATPGEENFDQVRQAALERAQEKAEALAEKSQQANSKEDVSDLAKEVAALQKDLQNLTNTPEPEQNSVSDSRKPPTANYDNALENLAQAEHTLSEAQTRQERAEAKQEEFAQQQLDGQRLLEETLDRRLPESVARDVERAAKEFAKHQDDPNRQADSLRQAGDRMREADPEVAKELKQQAEDLKKQAKAAQVARDDLNKIEHLAKEASQKAREAGRELAKLDEDASDWSEAVRERLDDNLETGQLDEARENIEALKNTALEAVTAAEDGSPTNAQETAEAALENALAKANAEDKSALEQSLDALRSGDVETAKALAEEVAAKRAPEAQLAEAARELANNGDPVESLRKAEENARQNKMAQAAAHAEQAGNPEELADQLAKAEDAIKKVVDEANKAAAQTEDRGREDVLRAAANAAKHNQLQEALQHLARTGEDGKEALAAVNEAKEQSQAAAQAAKEAYEAAKQNAPIAQAKNAAAEAAEAMRNDAQQLKQEAQQLAKTDAAQAAELRQQAQQTEQRARDLQQAGNQLNNRNMEQMAQKAESLAGASLAAAEAAAQLEQALAEASQAQAASEPGQAAGAEPSQGEAQAAATPPQPGQAPAGQPQPGQSQPAPPSSTPSPSSPASPSPESAVADAQVAAAADHLAEAQQALTSSAEQGNSAEAASPSASPSLSQAAEALAEAAQSAAAAAQAAQGPPAPGSPAPPGEQAASSEPGQSGEASESESAGEGAESATTIGSSAESSTAANHTWSKLWKGSDQELAGESSKGQVNQYGDYYRKANQRYLSRLSAESRRREAAKKKR